MTGVALGFIPEPLTVPIASILPSRRTPAGMIASRKFKQIRSSIEEVGLIEPLSVTPVDQASGNHVLLDGHLRLIAMQDLQFSAAACLVATDDESYTYNNRVNRLSTIQEHFMIRRAVERGVSPERLAKALAVDVSQILKRMALLDGICAEATELLKDRQFSPELVRALRKMKPTRQVECVELMAAANNLSVSYAEALLVATPASRLVEGKKLRKLTGVSPEQMAKMEREMSNLQGQYKLVEQTYGQDVLNLVLAKGYLARLLEDESVHRYLQAQQADLLVEFQAIVDAIALEQPALEAAA
ncbi:plasmid partitioning protein RepB C-terminal domain-containing protein [Burkholderia ubonensis]|uniref:plasmid partitioning protein RepB C-terminal domain-containing protein n=1 Tax=Burkholderia ubonensis TaxID=101571 RepID=UPI00075A18E7|nr:plasmid partitioning protein RepB C-terminal domain-containing protein [Burkholderia ubonensis]KVP09150.1 chromosome partitioning protein ParB [Burkholderia ubonensis]